MTNWGTFTCFHFRNIQEMKDVNSETLGARSIRPKSREILVQNQMKRKFSTSLFRKFWSTSGDCHFPGNLEIPGISVPLGNPFRISAWHSILVPTVTVEWRWRWRSQVYVYQWSVCFFLQMICRSFYGICTRMTTGCCTAQCSLGKSKIIRNDLNN